MRDSKPFPRAVLARNANVPRLPDVMASLPDSLLAALASGATVVTPNNRLARALAARFDSAQRRAGKMAWPAARVLPWNAWLATLWQDAAEADAVDVSWRLLSSAQSSYLWRRIVAARSPELIDRTGAARIAAEAWSLLHEWGTGGESWRGWANPSAAADDDTAAFAAWADRYHAALADAHAQDGAGLADRVAAAAPRVSAWRDAAAALAGFTDLSPQQSRLVSALTAAGMRIDSAATLPPQPARIWHSSHATARDEIVSALVWARALALAQPEDAIAIVIANLSQQRSGVASLAEDILCPALQWPQNEGATRPYNLSLGVPLADVDIVASALELLLLAHAPMPAGRVAALLRSPYLPGGRNAWIARSGLERRWLTQGRREVSLHETIAELQTVDPTLAQQWRAARDAAPPSTAATPRAWADGWRAFLARSGWPGERALSSAEYQARGAWDEALVQFAGIAALAGRMSSREALGALREELSLRIFQPEAPSAPIQVLGLLEAAGTPFDALWVAGLDAESWPRAPEPNPMLPLVWQRERNVPRSSAASEQAHARALTAQLARAAPDVVFSYAREAGDILRFASSLLPAGDPLPTADPDARVGTARQMFAARPALEREHDTHAPPLEEGVTVQGGAALVAAQGDCPFQAVAAFRLGAQPWPEPIDGLSATERGNLVHDALARFWRDVRTQAALCALSPSALDETIAKHVDAAIRALDPIRRRALPSAVFAQEALRISGLLRAWVTGFEHARAPFSVASVEQRTPFMLTGLLLTLRIDRIDALGDGGVAIIDYKTGEIYGPARWIEPRPRAPQLGLYALACGEATPTPSLRAVVYAQLRRGEIKVEGIAADECAWKGLHLPSELPDSGFAGWADVEAHWRAEFGALGAEIRSGLASVTPRNVAATCRQCRRQSLCRIGSAALGEEEGRDDE